MSAPFHKSSAGSGRKISPKILWLKLMVLDASDDGGSLLQIGGEDAADAVLVVVQAVPGHLNFDGGPETFQALDWLPRLKYNFAN